MKLKSRVNYFCLSIEKSKKSLIFLPTCHFCTFAKEINPGGRICGEDKLFCRCKWWLCHSASYECVCVCVWALDVNCGWRMQRGCALKSTGSWQELTEIQRRESDWCERLRGAEKKVKESFQELVRKVRSGLYGRKWWDKHYRRICLNRNGKIWRFSETESNNGKIKKKGNRWKMQREIMGSEKMAA